MSLKLSLVQFLFISISLTFLAGGSVYAVDTISTVAGYGDGDGFTATIARLNSPSDVAIDSSGNLFVAESSNHRIRKIAIDGTISTVAGTGEQGFSGDGGAAISAKFDLPFALAVDSSGNLFVADRYNNRIRKISVDGTISTVAGTGVPGFSGDGGGATLAWLNSPSGVAIDSSGNLFVADANNHRIRKVAIDGTISTVAGTGIQGFSGDGGAAASAQLNYPESLAVDSSDNLFVADRSNNRVRKIAADGTISTVAGTGVNGFSGDGGSATSAQLRWPSGLAVDSSGNIFVADQYNQRIRMIATNGIINTVVGVGHQGYYGDGGAASYAWLDFPSGLAVDSSGNLFVADKQNYRIRRVDIDGTISTIAGIGYFVHDITYTGDGHIANSAQLYYPSGVAVGSNGDFFVADTSNHRIRWVTRSGPISTRAGTGVAGFSGDGGPASSAQLYSPSGMTLDSSSNLYLADSFNHRIRKIATDGTISTIAGTGYTSYSGDGGIATSAQVYRPSGMVFDSGGNLFVADTDNHRIRKVTIDGTISTLAGTGVAGYAGDGGPASSAQLNKPIDLAIDNSGNLFVTDYNNHRIRKISVDGTISTVAGTGVLGFSGDGGPATLARFYYPAGIVVNNSGELFVADTNNYRIRKIAVDGSISTVAGTGVRGYSGDGGPATLAQFAFATELVFDSNGNLIVADSSNNRIRKISTDGTISTIAGTGTAGFSGDGGAATSANLWYPSGLAIDSSDNIFVSDRTNQRIRKITTDGTIDTMAGTGVSGFSGDGGTATLAQMDSPSDLAIDSNGHLFVADNLNNRIRKITTNGIISTVAGTGYMSYAGDGGPAILAQLNNPTDVAVDNSGNIFVADYYNHRIRRISADGTISTVAGTGVKGFSGDGGPATLAQLYTPYGVAADGSGNLFVADTTNHRIRKIAADGTISTIAGTGSLGYSGDGGPATLAQLYFPKGLSFDSSGNLFVADRYNHRIRKIAPDGTISTIAGNGVAGYSGDGGVAASAKINNPFDVAVDSSGKIYVADTYNHRIRQVGPEGSINLEVTVSGEGKVYIWPGTIMSCADNCSQQYAEDTFASLTAEPLAGYSFTGWAGNCGGSNVHCSLSMSENKSVTATFSLSPVPEPVQMQNTQGTFLTIQGAYDSIALGSADTIKVKAGEQTPENLYFDRNVSVRLEGGYSDNFTSVVSDTSLIGTLTISDGSATIMDLILK